MWQDNKLTSSEVHTVVHGLKIAAEHFRDNATELRRLKSDNQMITVKAAKHLAEQFDRQQREAYDMATRLELAAEITLIEDT